MSIDSNSTAYLSTTDIPLNELRKADVDPHRTTYQPNVEKPAMELLDKIQTDVRQVVDEDESVEAREARGLRIIDRFKSLYADLPDNVAAKIAFLAKQSYDDSAKMVSASAWHGTDSNDSETNVQEMPMVEGDVVVEHLAHKPALAFLSIRQNVIIRTGGAKREEIAAGEYTISHAAGTDFVHIEPQEAAENSGEYFVHKQEFARVFSENACMQFAATPIERDYLSPSPTSDLSVEERASVALERAIVRCMDFGDLDYEHCVVIAKNMARRAMSFGSSLDKDKKYADKEDAVMQEIRENENGNSYPGDKLYWLFTCGEGGQGKLGVVLVNNQVAVMKKFTGDVTEMDESVTQIGSIEMQSGESSSREDDVTEMDESVTQIGSIEMQSGESSSREDGTIDIHQTIACDPPFSGNGKSQMTMTPAKKAFCKDRDALIKLNHPNIVEFLGDGKLTDRNRPYYLMALVNGSPMSANEEMCDDEAYRIAACKACIQMADALQYCHTNNPDDPLLHRDIKPDNFMIDRQGKGKLIDFGLSKSDDVKATMELSQTHEGVVLGSAHYMSPEQANGNAKDATEASEVYSWGISLYEMLVGRPPYEYDGNVMHLLHQHVRRDVSPDVSMLPDVFADIIRDATAQNPEDRHPLMELRNRLAKAIGVSRNADMTLNESDLNALWGDEALVDIDYRTDLPAWSMNKLSSAPKYDSNASAEAHSVVILAGANEQNSLAIHFSRRDFHDGVLKGLLGINVAGFASVAAIGIGSEVKDLLTPEPETQVKYVEKVKPAEDIVLWHNPQPGVIVSSSQMSEMTYDGVVTVDGQLFEHQVKHHFASLTTDQARLLGDQVNKIVPESPYGHPIGYYDSNVFGKIVYGVGYVFMEKPDGTILHMPISRNSTGTVPVEFRDFADFYRSLPSTVEEWEVGEHGTGFKPDDNYIQTALRVRRQLKLLQVPSSETELQCKERQADIEKQFALYRLSQEKRKMGITLGFEKIPGRPNPKQ